MSWCRHCGQWVEEKGISETHSFAVYMDYLVYHPECCPRTLDGTDCDLDHPNPDYTPPRPERVAEG